MAFTLHRTGALAAALLLACAAAPPGVPSAQEPVRDALVDPALKGPEVVAFVGLRPGARVADIVAGRFVRAFSAAVGPSGRVYAIEPLEVLKVHPSVAPMITGLAQQPGYGNIELVEAPVNTPDLPPGLDAVFIRQNYHDLHDPFMGPADVAAFNRAVYAALKPGGVYVVLDHAAAAGSGLRDTNTLHRIEKAAVRSEVEAAGFVFAGESPILANPADDHTRRVFDPAIRGQTDQFLLKFRKPA